MNMHFQTQSNKTSKDNIVDTHTFPQPDNMLALHEEEDRRIKARRLSRSLAALLSYMATDQVSHPSDGDLTSAAELAWMVEENIAQLDDSMLAKETISSMQRMSKSDSIDPMVVAVAKRQEDYDFINKGEGFHFSDDDPRTMQILEHGDVAVLGVKATTPAGALAALKMARYDLSNFDINSSLDNKVMCDLMDGAIAGLEEYCRTRPDDSTSAPINADHQEASSEMSLAIEAHRVANDRLGNSTNAADEVWCQQNGTVVTQEAQVELDEAGEDERAKFLVLCSTKPHNPNDSAARADHFLAGKFYFGQEHTDAFLRSMTV